MTITELRDYCLSLPATTCDFPFDAETIVFRVVGRIFALSDINANPLSVNLKCEPAVARDLRAGYEAITPGYHMNKEHWITVVCGSDVPDEMLRRLIEHSYERVLAGIPKSRRPGRE